MSNPESKTTSPTVIIEEHNEYGVDWVFSLNGIHPDPGECIVLKSHFDALRVKQWYDALLKIEAVGNNPYHNDWHDYATFALENVP